MKLLLDTHTFLWIVGDDARLSPVARNAFRSSQNEVLLSVASIWEIVVKATRGKLPFPKPAAPYLREQIRQTRVEVLPIMLSHVFRLESLPMRHRDPFDRILVAQALGERIPLLSRDRMLGGYGVEILW